MDKINLTKWFALGLGGVIGISHIGMIGMLARRDSSKLPSLNMPVGAYTSYEAHVNEDGYSVSYRANDPKTMVTTIDRKAKGGFLGLANNTTKEVIEFTADGAAHHGGPVSTKTAWIDPAALAIQAAAPAVSGIPFVGWLAAGWVTMFGGDQGAELGGDMAEMMKDC